MSELRKMASSSNCPKLHVIFLHGLTGDLVKSWSALKDKKKFWPEWLAEDLNDISIWTIGYNNPLTRYSQKTLHFTDRAVDILDTLTHEEELRCGK